MFEIGALLRSPAIGLVAALTATLHPYVVWHDVHANREVLDGLVLALLVFCALLAYEEPLLVRSRAEDEQRQNEPIKHFTVRVDVVPHDVR